MINIEFSNEKYEEKLNKICEAYRETGDHEGENDEELMDRICALMLILGIDEWLSRHHAA